MLRELSIRDYAIIERLELEFDSGLTVLTGETGAGKSIIVDALGLVLGDRADSGAVRHGSERAEICATFEVPADGPLPAWLREHDLDPDGPCILRRVIGADARSRGYINGTPTPLTLMRELGEQLVDIHGQHEHQSLLRRDMQLALVDAHGALTASVTTLGAAYRGWRDANDAWQELSTAAADRASRLDLLRFQLRELDGLALTDGELGTLEVEHARFANAGRLVEAAQRALAATDGDEPPHARGLLHDAASALAEVAELDPKLAEIHALFEQSLISLGEGADDLGRWLDRFDMDPERKAFVEQRIGTAHQLARKHRVTPDELPALHERLRSEYDALDHADERLGKLDAERARLAKVYRDASAALSKARTKTARSLGRAITESMQTLGMAGGKFEIAVEHDAERFAASGGDQVEFRVSANPGQPLRPLAKVASGGELSRISLALQVTAAPCHKSRPRRTIICALRNRAATLALARTLWRSAARTVSTNLHGCWAASM
ncbi:MAG: DNA repair protein RecN [Xanthomonadaceae bacterium]|nr:DNA repair protein RecN [Xanthomonadaceae bacterium]